MRHSREPHRSFFLRRAGDERKRATSKSHLTKCSIPLSEGDASFPLSPSVKILSSSPPFSSFP